MIKVGNIYRNIIDKKLVVTSKEEIMDMYGDEAFVVYDIIDQDGNTFNEAEDDFFTRCELVAEYPTWQEAINSKEFKG